VPLLEDIGTILNQVGNNLVGDIGMEFNQAKEDALISGDLKPLVRFYNDNEQELALQGFSLNDVIGVNQSNQNALIEYGQSDNYNIPADLKSAGIFKEFVLPTLGIIAGGAAILILIKTLKK
jgi:hypothetical protein|tara:strand:+ start:11988 stop:12353 length:366 start_codon:yes stop_codon:yes gene_type:complete